MDRDPRDHGILFALTEPEKATELVELLDRIGCQINVDWEIRSALRNEPGEPMVSLTEGRGPTALIAWVVGRPKVLSAYHDLGSDLGDLVRLLAWQTVVTDKPIPAVGVVINWRQLATDLRSELKAVAESIDVECTKDAYCLHWPQGAHVRFMGEDVPGTEIPLWVGHSLSRWHNFGRNTTVSFSIAIREVARGYRVRCEIFDSLTAGANYVREEAVYAADLPNFALAMAKELADEHVRITLLLQRNQVG